MTETSTSVADLEKRIAALEVGATFEATKTEVEKVERECLEKLQDIRAAMASGRGSSNAGSSKEIEAIKAENELLKQKNAKLEYRVQHMLSTMEDLYAKQKNQ